MKGLLIKCPECGNRLNIARSDRPSAKLTMADAYCSNCHLKAEINAQLVNIKQGQFSPVADNHIWQQDRVITQKLRAKK